MPALDLVPGTEDASPFRVQEREGGWDWGPLWPHLCFTPALRLWAHR